MDGITVRLHNDNMNWWLELPTTYEKLLQAMTEMGAADGNFTIDRCRTGFDGKLDKLIIGSDLAAVNYFAIRLEELSPEQVVKLEALVDSPMRDVVFQSMERLIDFTYNTDFVELTPGVHNAVELARHYFDHSGQIELPAGWAMGVDLQKFGENLETEKAGCYTKHGYLTPTGAEWQPVFEKTGKIPPDYQIQPESGRHAPVYPHSIDFARQNGDIDLYRESLTQNMFCALDIEETVRKHTGYGYRPDRSVVQGVIDRFGQERVLAVLAHTVRERDFGVRYSQESRDWAKGYPAPPPSEHARFTVESHPDIVDDLIALARGIAREREAPDVVHGYVVKQYTLFGNNRGFALAENPNAAQPFVTWQFTEENGKRDYYWGHYCGRIDTARGDFAARVRRYLADYGVEVKHNYLAAAEMSTEQNYNMIDGVRNNEAPAERFPVRVMSEGQPTVTIHFSEHEELAAINKMPLYLADALFAELDARHLEEQKQPGFDKAWYMETKFTIDYIMDGKADGYSGEYVVGMGYGSLIDKICDHAEYFRHDPACKKVMASCGADSSELEASDEHNGFILDELVPFFRMHCKLSEMEAAALSELFCYQHDKAHGIPVDEARAVYLESVVGYAWASRDALNNTGIDSLPEEPKPYAEAPEDRAAPVHGQEHGKPSVMKQIRAAQKASKPPRKEKSPDKQKDGPEL